MWMKLYDSDASQKTPSSYKRESDTRDNAEEKIGNITLCDFMKHFVTSAFLKSNWVSPSLL